MFLLCSCSPLPVFLTISSEVYNVPSFFLGTTIPLFKAIPHLSRRTPSKSQTRAGYLYNRGIRFYGHDTQCLSTWMTAILILPSTWRQNFSHNGWRYHWNREDFLLVFSVGPFNTLLWRESLPSVAFGVNSMDTMIFDNRYQPWSTTPWAPRALPGPIICLGNVCIRKELWIL